MVFDLQVTEQLTHYYTVEFAGVEVNPPYKTLMRAVEVCRQHNLNFILAVGGGSVLDGAKFVAGAFNYEGDPWKLMLEKYGLSGYGFTINDRFLRRIHTENSKRAKLLIPSHEINPFVYCPIIHCASS